MLLLPSQPPTRILLLVNPNARRGDNGLEAAVDVFERRGIQVALDAFSGPDEVERDIDAMAGNADCIVVAGGDGTLSRAGAAVGRRGLPLGVLPAGTANDLARTLGIPDDFTAAAQVIADGRRRRIDLGRVNGHPFFNVASIGLSAELARTLSGELKRRWGRLGYALAGVRVLARARPFSAWITENGETVKVRTLQIAVGNGRHYGGGTVIEETATIDDARLDLYSLELSQVWKLALMLRPFRSGTHGAWSEVRTARNVEFDVTTREGRPVNVDGDIVTATPAHFSVEPEAVTVYVPADRPEG